MATFEVGVRGVDLTILKFIAKVMGAKAIEAVMTASEAVSAITKGVALFDIVACLTAPIAHLVVVFTSGVYGMIVDGNLGPVPSFAFEVRGLVHLAIDAATDAGNSIGGSKSF